MVAVQGPDRSPPLTHTWAQKVLECKPLRRENLAYPNTTWTDRLHSDNCVTAQVLIRQLLVSESQAQSQGSSFGICGGLLATLIGLSPTNYTNICTGAGVAQSV
jgi:hypothetical protein